ncbi:MAG: hypothetical protein IJA10_04570 [Lachnospiraceae bacterium]|nr:hypothetical protein [Lachnospiraceae bacterium]
MMKKVKLVLAFLWESMIAFTAPFCIGLLYMDFTGHSKGYGYELGSERGLYVWFGFIELIIWILLSVPCGVYLFKQMRKIGLRAVWLTAGVMLLLFACCILLMGVDEFLACFGYKQ